MLLFRSSKIFYSDLQIVLVNIKKMAYSPNDNSLIVLDSSPEFAKTQKQYISISTLQNQLTTFAHG